MEDTATDLSHLTIRELTARLSTREPIPGGGSAAAIAGSMGAALVGMVAELTIGRPDAGAQAVALKGMRDAAALHRVELLALAETDAAAYDAVVRARRLPKESDSEREERRRAVASAMRQAADVPLRTARSAMAVLELAARVAPIGNPNAVSDAGVGAQLASAAVRGAALNVRINLPYLEADDPLRAEGKGEVAALEARAGDLEQKTLEVVLRRIGPS